jgi:hypothetical protein
MSLILQDQSGEFRELEPSVFALGVGTSPESAAGIVPTNLLSADRLLDVHKPDWVTGDDIQLRVGDLILNSRHSGSSDVQADGQRGANGNLGLGAKGLIFFYTQDSPTDFSIKMRLGNNGNLGIGSSIRNPEERLEVEGNLLVRGDVRLAGADCAEDFDVDESQPLEAGMVMVIGEEERLCRCGQAYDQRVAGVLSGAGDCRPGIVLGKRSSPAGRLPLALTGRVYCKVDADYSPIGVADLLTTSPTPGHAMKATDRVRAFGAIIGKALRPFPQGRGLIPILVGRQ